MVLHPSLDQWILAGRNVHECPGDVQWETCLINLDNVIVFGKTELQTLDRLDAILSRIGQAGLKLKPSKCSLFKKRAHYLGHIVTRE